MEISAHRQILLLVADGMVDWLENCGNSECLPCASSRLLWKRGGALWDGMGRWEAEIEEDSTMLVIQR